MTPTLTVPPPPRNQRRAAGVHLGEVAEHRSWRE